MVEDSPLHRSMKLIGVDKFKFEILDEVDYIDPDQLLMRESVLMLKYDTIENGFNCKLSIDLENWFKKKLHNIILIL